MSIILKKTEDGRQETEVRKIDSSDFGLQTSDFKRSLGDYSGGVPPLPIPNREVKPASADGTALLWESRSSPTLNRRVLLKSGTLFTFNPIAVEGG